MTQDRISVRGTRGRATTTVLALAIVLAVAGFATGPAEAQNFSTLATFNFTDGAIPYAGLVQGADGNFYGTTVAGGANCSNQSAFCGTVFKVTPSGILTTLYNFCSQSNCTDGAIPYAGLVQGADGNFYGVTYVGGTSQLCADNGSNIGCGTVFKITPGGSLTTLYNFCSQSNCTDGAFPYTALIQASDGSFYGTTVVGGASGAGTIFKVTPGGTLTTLYSFCPQSGCPDGAEPFGALLQGSDGNFYGTTYLGGTGQSCTLNNGSSECGTVFKITPSGTLTTLYNFCSQSNCTDGDSPNGALIQASDGNFYGTTTYGGANQACTNGNGDTGCGTVFKITSSGALTTLYNFCPQSGCADGAEPGSGLIQGTDGNFYGTTIFGGANSSCSENDIGCGVAFKITPGGTLTTLYSFCSQSNCTDGTLPYAALIQGANGNFYGTTLAGGGTNNYGTVFTLSAGGGTGNQGSFAYIAGSGGVSLLDTTTDLVVNAIPISGEPYELAVSPDQTKVYVADNAGNSVSVVATANNTVTATIPVGLGPDGVAVTPNGQFVYVANNDANNPTSNTVSVISTASNSVVQTVTVGPAPFLPKVTPDGSLVYVASTQGNELSVINTSTNTVTATVPITAPTGLAFAPNGALAYVAQFASPGTLTVLAVPSNRVVATIPLGSASANPIKVAITPDGSLVYVTNLSSNNVSVVETGSNSVIATVPVGNQPYAIAVSTDGSQVYVGNAADGTISVISTATNSVVATVPVADGVFGIAVASAPPMSQPITQPLSPTQPNVFNFGTNNQVVQYPPGTNFSGVNMTTTAVEITQAQFQQRVAGTKFASAACIVYSGTGGNCIDYQVTCSDNSGNPITCPGEPQPTIAVQTSFTTAQTIVNPGYLTTPIGQNQWTNIFTGYADPTVKGRTVGFSEFVAVDLGATNPQGLAQFKLLHPVFPKKIGLGREHPTPVAIRLTSVATGKPITDARVGISVVMIADGKGNPTQQVVLSKLSAFKQEGAPGTYKLNLHTAKYALGTYTVTIYGNAFPAYQGQLQIVK